jgi:hypothetical protein
MFGKIFVIIVSKRIDEEQNNNSNLSWDILFDVEAY